MSNSDQDEKQLQITLSNPDQDHDHDQDEDRFSKLPDHIIHEILCLVPIELAAQTSVLSRRWKNVFSSIPDLDLMTIPPPYPPPNRYDPMFDTKVSIAINFVNNVLSRRDKSISIRALKLFFTFNMKMNESLRKSATISDIQELDVDSEYSFDFPWSRINYESLRILSLNLVCFPVIDDSIPLLLRRNRNFKNLHTLTLSKFSFQILIPQYHEYQPVLVDIFNDTLFPCLKKLTLRSCYDLIHLNVHCSELEDLVIAQCYELNVLDIHGLKLHRLKVDDCFGIVDSTIKVIAPAMRDMEWVGKHINHYPNRLEKLFLLEKAHIRIYLDDEGEIEPRKLQNFFNTMSALSHVKSLKFQYPTHPIFSRLDIIGNIFPNKFEHLRTLEIDIKVCEFKMSKYLVVAKLLVNSPYIHTLIIRIDTDFILIRKAREEAIKWSIDDNFWDDKVLEMNSFLNHIKMVKLIGFLEGSKYLILIKILLKHGKVLENIILCPVFTDENRFELEEKIMSMMMEFSWASTKARIVFDSIFNHT